MKGIVYVNLPDSQPVYLDFPLPVGRVVINLDRMYASAVRLQVSVSGNMDAAKMVDPDGCHAVVIEDIRVPRRRLKAESC